jgi:predicted aminopeptidase
MVSLIKINLIKKNVFKYFIYLIGALLLSSCQVGYIAESAYYQAQLLRQRVPLKYALENYKLDESERKKIELTIDVRDFMKSQLKLDTQSNYLRYVHLDRPYVSYAVNAAPKNELKQFTWHFPIIGSVPYKAYFKKASAEKEVEILKNQNLDTYLRGVTAYSTLGWFEDPLLSSMLKMKDHDFVNTLIHETVHANLYIKGQGKFNERIASFLGQLGAEAYYAKLNRSDELKNILKDESHDDLLFSSFISQELKDLRNWYKENGKKEDLLSLRENQFKSIQSRFTKNFLPKMKTKNYNWFPEKELNNAFLLLLELYSSDFDELEQLANQFNRDFNKVFKTLQSLESSKNPENDLKKLITKL